MRSQNRTSAKYTKGRNGNFSARKRAKENLIRYLRSSLNSLQRTSTLIFNIFTPLPIKIKSNFKQNWPKFRRKKRNFSKPEIIRNAEIQISPQEKELQKIWLHIWTAYYILYRAYRKYFFDISSPSPLKSNPKFANIQESQLYGIFRQRNLSRFDAHVYGYGPNEGENWFIY